jgi:hypothetical protein
MVNSLLQSSHRETKTVHSTKATNYYAVVSWASNVWGAWDADSMGTREVCLETSATSSGTGVTFTQCCSGDEGTKASYAAGEHRDCNEQSKTYDEALAYCEGNGQRLCTKDELVAEAAAGRGCRLDGSGPTDGSGTSTTWNRAWTSTPCIVQDIIEHDNTKTTCSYDYQIGSWFLDICNPDLSYCGACAAKCDADASCQYWGQNDNTVGEGTTGDCALYSDCSSTRTASRTTTTYKKTTSALMQLHTQAITYTYLDGDDCPDGTMVPASVSNTVTSGTVDAECETAAEQLGFTIKKIQGEGTWNHVPPGCFVHKGCSENCVLHVGTKSSSTNNGNYRAICRAT